MSPEETRTFAMNYYGWDDEKPEADRKSLEETLKRMEEMELLFE